MAEVTHTDKGNGMSFYTSLNLQAVHICVPFGSDIVCTRFDRG